MNRQEFIDALRRRLTDEGFSAEYVDTQCDALTEKLNGLDDATAGQYTSARNLDIIVRKLVSQDGDQIVAEPAEELPAESVAPRQTVSQDVQFVDESTLSPDRRGSRVAAADEYLPCDKPKLLTALLVLICAPTLILLLAVAFGLFGGVFMALAASIFGIVIAIVGIVGAGSVLSVGALLYGATQVLSSPRYVGFHEIGFGLIVAGVTMASSILLYNAAIRLIPYIYLKMGKLLKLFSKKLVYLAKNAVKGVEQL